MLLVGCATVSTNSEYIEINKANVEIKKGFSFSEIADSTLYVALETKPDCLIGEVRMIEKLDSLLFILDYSPNLFVFNTNGKFINQIGKIGDGPNEYVGINAFYLDKKNKRVVIIDEMKGALIHYDYYGKFIESERINSDLIKSCQQSILS